MNRKKNNFRTSEKPSKKINSYLFKA